MNKNFVLSEKLRLYLSIGSSNEFIGLGDRFPVSIRKRYSFSQTIVIYPESDCSIYTIYGLNHFMSLADVLDLTIYVTTENGVPIVRITDNNINDK